jgi:hypothetical protein
MQRAERRALWVLMLFSLASCGAEELRPPADELGDFEQPLVAGELARINFQPQGSPVPTDYKADTGLGFSAARGYGWLERDTAAHAPLDLTPNTRDRAYAFSRRLGTFMTVQGTDVNNPTLVKTPARWEYAIANGTYVVRAAVGDSAYLDSAHRLNAEGAALLPEFLPAANRRFFTQAQRVTVTDGKLSIDARGGNNTKLCYLEISVGDRPAVRKTSPTDAETNVAVSVVFNAELITPFGGVADSTFSASTVVLREAVSGAAIPGSAFTSGGADVINFRPAAVLKANTSYVFSVTAGVKDVKGKAFLPYALKFKTGDAPNPDSDVAFTKTALPSTEGVQFTSLAIGPDHKLYAGTLTGHILRYAINADGTLGAVETIATIPDRNGGYRYLIGLRFDPAATASNLILWTTHTGFFSKATLPADFTGKLTRLSGPTLTGLEDVLVGLPRSIKDHVTNSIDFNPKEPGVVYLSQGANSAMGRADITWGDRPERLLTAAILRVELSAILSRPLNVKTVDSGGPYDPFDANAPVTIYASGVRNAFDLLWHSNGNLYSATNGSSSGGNTPGTPATLPASCSRRIDGTYDGAKVPQLTNVGTSQHDFMFRIVRGGYYGSPNPTRCEWVLNGGNPTSAADKAQVSEYEQGVAPDRNWRSDEVFDVGDHASANGTIEYRNAAAFGGALKGKILVTRYAVGADLIVLHPNGTSGRISKMETGAPGMTGFANPLDLTEDVATGNLYVSELSQIVVDGQKTFTGRLVLLKPKN